MKKEILIAILCTCLILVTPFSVVARENKISSNLTDEPDVEELVAQIRTIVNDALQKFRHIPIVKGLCNMIINTIDMVGIGRLILCVFLFSLLIPLALIAGTFLVLDIDYFWQIFGGLTLIVAMIMDDWCSEYYNSPFQSIYTMLETKPYPDYPLDDCPCLQEGGI